MKRLLLNIIILILILFPSISFSLESGTYDHLTYWRYSGDTVKLAWSAIVHNEDTIVYEVNIYHCETEQIIVIGETQNTSIDIRLPRVGHYVFKVRSWLLDKSMNSEWAESSNPAYALNNKSFWVYCQLPKVTGAGIE